MNTNDIEKRAHVLKHSHRRCVVGAFDKILHEGSILTGTRSVLYFPLHKSIFLHFLHHGTQIYDKYINTDDREKYINDDGSGIFQNKRLDIFTMQNIWIHMEIEVILFLPHI